MNDTLFDGQSIMLVATVRPAEYNKCDTLDPYEVF